MSPCAMVKNGSYYADRRGGKKNGAYWKITIGINFGSLLV